MDSIRSIIESIVINIIRSDVRNALTVLDSIALYICRANYHSLYKKVLTFDYDDLFADGTLLINNLQNVVGYDKLRILSDNFAITSDVLSDISRSYFINRTPGCMTIKEVTSTLFSKWLSPEANSQIYLPYGGDPHVVLNYQNNSFLIDLLSERESRFTLLKLVAHNAENYTVRITDPVANLGDGVCFKYILMPTMPMDFRNQRFDRKKDETTILSMIDALEEGGKMVVVVPSTFLSSETYFELRKTLVENEYLRLIVNFDQKEVFSINSVRFTAIFIEKNRSNIHTFDYVDTRSINYGSKDDNFSYKIDNIVAGDPDYIHKINYSSVVDSSNYSIIDYSNRSTRRFREGFKPEKLSSILTPYKKTEVVEDDKLHARLSGKDMHLEFPNYMITHKNLEYEKLFGRYTCINEGVLCFHSLTRNCIWCVGEKDASIYCNNSIYTYTIKDKRITPEYLCCVLLDEDVKADIKNHMVGATIPRVSRDAFLDIEIPIPATNNNSRFKQELLLYIYERKSQLVELEKESHNETLDEIRDDIEDKIHLLGPYNFSIQSGLNRILKMLHQNETLDRNTPIFSDICLERYVSNLLNKSISAGYITASIGKTIFEEVTEPLDSFIFLQKYVEYLESDISYMDVTFNLETIKKPYLLMITDRSLRMVLDTIIRNANLHGFSDPFNGTKKISIRISEDNVPGMAVLSISNNGLRASKDFTEDLYRSKFGKCGKTANTGRGGYFVNNAIQFYKGAVSVKTDDKTWSFIVELHIPLSYE